MKWLDVFVLSPSFFGSTNTEALRQAFQSLVYVELTFRFTLAEKATHIAAVTNGEAHSYGNFLGDGLHGALAAATNLEEIHISFDGHGIPHGDPENVLGDTTWPKLRNLHLDNVCFTEQYFGDSLRRQPSLSCVYLGFATITAGSWVAMYNTVQGLRLLRFVCSGVFKDLPESLHYVMDYVRKDLWLGERFENTMVSSRIRPQAPSPYYYLPEGVLEHDATTRSHNIIRRCSLVRRYS